MKFLKIAFVSFVALPALLGSASRADEISGAVAGSESRANAAAGIGTRPADDSVRIVGNLPYANQWSFERPGNFLYLNWDTASLASPVIPVSHFKTQYGSANLNFISIDFFSRLSELADPLGSSFFRRFSFWGRYKLGVATQQGVLIDDTTSTVLQAEKNSILVGMAQVELAFSYDWSNWVQPFVGFSYKPYYYRNSSSMPGAETEGSSNLYGPSLGLHLPVLFGHRGTLFGEVHQDIASGDSKQIFIGQTTFDFGAGLVF